MNVRQRIVEVSMAVEKAARKINEHSQRLRALAMAIDSTNPLDQFDHVNSDKEAMELSEIVFEILSKLDKEIEPQTSVAAMLVGFQLAQKVFALEQEG